MKKYGYFGEGLDGYMHYMQSFEENFSSENEDYSYNSFESDSEVGYDELSFSDDDSDDYFLFDDEDENYDFDDEEDEELPTMTIDGHITLGPDESETDFMLKFEDFLEENGWSFDGFTIDD